MTTVNADLKDVAGISDNASWIFAAPLREGSDGSIVTPRRVPVKPVDGVLTVDLDPGFCEVHIAGKKFDIEVPDTASVDLWDLLAAALAFPPETSQSKVAAAVSAYLDLNPIDWDDLDKPTFVGAGSTAAAARTVIGAAKSTEVRDQTLAAATVTKLAEYWTRPTWPAVVAIGDSITDAAQTQTAWTGSSGSRMVGYQATGFLACAMVWNRQQATWIEAGTGGETAAQCLARFDTDVTPIRPEVVVEAAGTNDIIFGVSAATTFTSKLGMWRKAWAFGAKVIANTIAPRDNFSTAQEQEAHKLNSMLRRFAATNPYDFALVDWYAILVDPLTNNFKAGHSDDGIHPNSVGAWLLGKAYESALDRFLPEATPPLAMANVNDLDNLLTNPLLTGTAGTKTSNTGVTGQVADGWTAAGTGTDATMTAALSKVARSDGFGDWQQVTISVSPAATARVQMYRMARTEFAAGDVIQGCVDFETDAAGYSPGSLDCQLFCFNASSTILSIARALHPGNPTLAVRPESGVLLTPPIEIPPGVTAIQMSLVCGSLGTTRFGRPSLRKLAAA